MKMRTVLSLCVGALAALGSSSMPASASAPTPMASAHGASSAHTSVHFLPPPRRAHSVVSSSTDIRQGTPPLLDHGGPILATEQSYAIYWNPGHLQNGAPTSIGSTYKALVQRWFTDAGATGVLKNNIQYPSNGHTPTSTSFAAAWQDTTPFPVGHCTNAVTGVNCVTDTDIATLVQRQAQAHGIKSSMSKMFFVYTPKGEGSCFDGTCSDGAYTQYCAYHGSINVGTTHLIYADMPWQTAPNSAYNCYGTAAYGTQTYPSGNVAADAVVNVTSHEQNEAITDPLVNVNSAWYDSAGYENGDECAWEFAPTTTGGGDVYVNGHAYSVQMEASNQARNCVISGPAGP